jgi:hypothetical protein
MTNIQKRTEMVFAQGFNRDLTDSVVGALNKKATKANAQVLERINQSDYYQILSNGVQFTIHSQYHNHKYEIEKIAKIVGLEYIRCGTMIDNNGLWLEWVKL